MSKCRGCVHIKVTLWRACQSDVMACAAQPNVIGLPHADLNGQPHAYRLRYFHKMSSVYSLRVCKVSSISLFINCFI